MKYYMDNEAYGVMYDWNKIEKEYKKLEVPQEFYQIPWQAIKAGNKYFITLSERKTGKTTNYLLLGLVILKLYPGRPIQYVRETESMLAPKFASKLIDVIRTYNKGEYVRRLTDGRWNSIYYHWQAFYYCNMDDNGMIVEKSTEEIIHCLSLDKWADYKSAYNTLGDFVLFDEFIGPYYRMNSWLDFCQITSTIFRFRLGGIVVMAANNINANSMYFEELQISREAKALKKGQSTQIITKKGTKIFLQMVDGKEKQSNGIRDKINELFYGFGNTALASITGEDVYAYASYPHIAAHDDSYELLQQNMYIETGTELLRLDLAYNDAQGTHLEVHKATKTYDDSIIFSLAYVEDQNHFWGFGSDKLAKRIASFVSEHRIYFSSNEVGAMFDDYFNRYLQQRKKVN